MLEPEQKEEIIHYTSMSLFICATVCVLIYFFTASIFTAHLALALYVVSFASVCLFSVRKLFVAKYYLEKIEKQELPTDATTEQSQEQQAKKQKLQTLIKSATRREIVKLVLSGALAIFTLVVLILF